MIYFFDDRTPSRGTRHIWYGTFHRRSYPLHLPLTNQIKEMLHLKKDLLKGKKKILCLCHDSCRRSAHIEVNDWVHNILN